MKCPRCGQTGFAVIHNDQGKIIICEFCLLRGPACSTLEEANRNFESMLILKNIKNKIDIWKNLTKN